MINPSRSTAIAMILVIAQTTSPRVMADDVRSMIQVRRPVAVAVIDDGRQLITVNERSGTISVVDLRDQKVVRETAIGRRLSDIVVTADPQRFLVTDSELHELVAVRHSATEDTIEKRIAVSAFPVSVRVDDSGSFAYVASLWSRTITVVDLNAWLSDRDSSESYSPRQIVLPFAPREQLVLNAQDLKRRGISKQSPGLKLVVADAFSSKLAVIDPSSGHIDSVRDIPAHAIRGLRLHPTEPRLVISHQMLNGNAHTTFDDIHWGNLLANCLRSLHLSDVVDPDSDLLKKCILEFVGGPNRGAADPAGIVIRPDGRYVIALSGTDEVVIDEGDHLFASRVKTEHRPTSIVMSADGSHAFVVNTLSDSVSIIGLIHKIVVATISLGPRPELTAIDRGEILFHSGKLSHDNWLSCASCHVDGHTIGQLNDNLTDGTFGTAKRVLTLRGIADTAPYAWAGRFPTLSEQIEHSIRSTMQGEPLEHPQTSDLEAFLRSLPPAPGVDSQNRRKSDRGESLFEKLDCRRCHVPPTFTSAIIVDIQRDDGQGHSKLNPPSLRGVSQNGPYFHDGRAATLESVFTTHRHQLDRELTKDEIQDLITFLRRL